jgi:hypothetical protein
MIMKFDDKFIQKFLGREVGIGIDNSNMICTGKIQSVEDGIVILDKLGGKLYIQVATINNILVK